MIDTSAAEAYENFLVPFAFHPWAKLVIEAAGLQPSHRVLDIGCGTGVAASLAASIVKAGGSVVGADVDEGMLSVARRTAADAGAAQIDWQRADATDLPFSADSFDFVLSFESLQFFPDRAKGLAEIWRVLKPKGRLIGTLWGPLEKNAPYHALAEGLAEFVSAEAARLPPFSLADPGTVQTLLTHAGFDDVKVEPKLIVRPVPSAAEFVQWVAAGAPTTRLKLSLLPDASRQAFLSFVEQRLEKFRRGSDLELPTMRHVFMAAKAP